MVLVTGATGFVGSHLLLRLLEKGEVVRALYRNAAKIEAVKSLFVFYRKEDLFSGIEWLKANITDIPSLEGAFGNIDHVYHCAALVSFDPKDEGLLRKTNIEGTANMVNLSLVHNIRKLCFVSSIAALGDLQEHESALNEETEWNPEKYHSDYAISKYGAEMEIWRGQQEGLNVVIVNPGIIIGPWSKNSGIGQVFSKAAHNMSYCSKGNSGFVAIEDVVNIMCRLMQSDIAGERFILVGENLSFEKLLQMIATSLGAKPPKKYAGKWLTETLWRLDWLVSNLFFSKRKWSKAISKSLHTTDFYSNAKIKKTLDLEFIPVVGAIAAAAAYFTGN